MLGEFLGALAPVLRQRTFIPGSDIGTSNEMVRRSLMKLGVPVHARELQGRRSGYFTALSTFFGALHPANHFGLPLTNARIPSKVLEKQVPRLQGCSLPLPPAWLRFLHPMGLW
jgi:hypothetical protein